MVIHYGIGKGARIFQGKRLPLPDSANNPSLITGARTNSKQTGTVSGNASSRDIFGCSKNRQNRIVENSTYPLDDFGFR